MKTPNYQKWQLAEGTTLVMQRTKANRKWQVYIVEHDILQAPTYLAQDVSIDTARQAVANALQADVMETY